MSRYITFADVTLRYPAILKVGSESTVGSAYIGYVENEIDGMLASHFTVPFSSNNMTVKDLAIDLTYIKAGNFTFEQAKEMLDDFMEKIKALKNGEHSMLTDSGDVITTVGDTAWSNTMDYTPVFGMSPIEYSEVDSSQIYDEEVDRGNI